MKVPSIAFLLLLAVDTAMAAGRPTPEACRTMPAKPVPTMIMTSTFMDAHPDLQWRRVALEEYRKGEFADALRDFKRSASYADKFSQSMVASMYWNGQGTTVDRALGYAWMDLAAEREYHNFAQQREAYWAMLDEAERVDAVQRGQAVYTEYSDEVAKPRMEKELDRVTRNITGSRTGFVSSGMEVKVRNPNGEMVSIPGAIFYDRNYYDPELYWCTQDAYWSRPLNPHVDVGDLVPLSDSTQPTEVDPGN